MDQETVKTDVLIIGAGAAGCRAAVAAAEVGVDVLIVAKNPVTKGGITPVGGGGFSTSISSDSLNVHFKDIVEGGRFLSDQNLVQTMIEEQTKAFDFLKRCGIKLEMRNGKFVQWVTPGQTKARLLKILGGGYALMLGLKKEVQHHSNIKFVEDMLITKLVVSENKVRGAIGLELRRGIPLNIQAKAVVLATGGAGQLWLITDCPPDSTGDGYALAYHAGAKLVDMEQQLFYPTVGIIPDTIYGTPIFYEWCLDREQGGWLVNTQGERFFPPEVLPTRDISARMIFEEIYSGKGTKNCGVYFDITKCEKARREKLASEQRCNRRLLELGIDLRSEMVEVAPGAHTTLGGVRINEKAETSVGGLFAAGECSGNVHGANRIAGHAYLETQVFGEIAGKNAAGFAKENWWNCVDAAEARKECERIVGLVGERKKGIRPNELKNRLRKIVNSFAGPIRNQEGLETAMKEISLLRWQEMPRLCVTAIKEYNNEWIEAIEVSSMLDVAEMVINSALLRKESRGTHFRKDYPRLDNENWLNHITIELKNGKMKLETDSVVMNILKPTNRNNEANSHS